MKTQIGYYLVGFLLAAGVIAGAYLALFGTDLSAREWTTRRSVELVLGLAGMLASGWWLLDRSSRSQLLKTLALTILLAVLGASVWSAIQLYRGHGVQPPGGVVKGVLLAIVLASVLIHIGMPKATASSGEIEDPGKPE